MRTCALFFLLVAVLIGVLLVRSPVRPASFSVVGAPRPASNASLPLEWRRCDNVDLTGAESFERVLGDDKHIYTGVANGQILALPVALDEHDWCDGVGVVLRVGERLAREQFYRKSHLCGDERVEAVCGRPLGLAADKTARGILYVADAYFGLLKLDVFASTVETLTNALPGARPFVFTNAVVVDEHNAYFTVSSRLFQRRRVLWELLDARCTGALMQYNFETNTTSLLVDDLCFANGLEWSHYGTDLLVVETTRLRIRAVSLSRTHEKATEVTPRYFINPLPGFPDNIRYDETLDCFWVAMGAPFDPRTAFLQQWPLLRQLIVSVTPVPKLFRIARASGFAACYDLDGNMKQHFLTEKDVVAYVSEVTTVGDYHLIGSFRNDYIGVLKR